MCVCILFWIDLLIILFVYLAYAYMWGCVYNIYHAKFPVITWPPPITNVIRPYLFLVLLGSPGVLRRRCLRLGSNAAAHVATAVQTTTGDIYICVFYYYCCIYVYIYLYLFIDLYRFIYV